MLVMHPIKGGHEFHNLPAANLQEGLAILRRTLPAVPGLEYLRIVAVTPSKLDIPGVEIMGVTQVWDVLTVDHLGTASYTGLKVLQ